MIYKATYNNVDTDLNISIIENKLNIQFTKFIIDNVNINKNVNCNISFSANTKYNKNISIFLLKDGMLTVDEHLDDIFYFETAVENMADKICWFTIPVNYTGILNDLEIFTKGV